MTIDEMQVLITANADNFQKEMKSVQKELKKLNKSAEQTGKKIPKSFAKAGAGAVLLGNIITKVVSTAFRALTGSIGDAVKRLDTIKNYPRVMQSLGYSASDAEASIKVLSDRLLGLPTSLDDMVRATQQLATISPSLASATERALAMNNALLAGGQGAIGASRGMTQFNQMLATGKADMQSWKILTEVMAGQLQQLSISLLGAGSNGFQLQEAIQNGTVTMQQFADEVIKLNNNGVDGFASFEEQARNATGGIGTSITNIKIAITRGLATIMDAIGQANIAGFFNAVSSAIGRAIPYVVAFVQAIMMAVSWVSRLFGGSGASSGAKSVEDSVAGTAESMGEVAGSAGDAGSALGGAGKEAKKLQKAMAGFDEMTVLTEKDSGASGSGSAGGAGGIGGGEALQFPEPDTSKMESAKDKVAKILDKIKKAFKKFAEHPFVKSFVDVFKILAIFGKKVFDNVLKPIAMLVFDKVVGFFEAIGQNQTAMQIMGTVMGALVASLAIVTIAMGIWTVVTTIATAVTTAFGVVMALVTSPIGLVVLAIMAIIVIAVLLVKHWDKVKNFAIKTFDKIKEVIGKVWEWLKDNVDLVVGILTGPFGLLVLNIVRNWDKIKELFKTGWAWLKSKAGTILAILTGPFGLAVRAIIQNWDKIKSTAQRLWTSIKSIFSGVTGFFGGIWETIKSKFTSIGSTIGGAMGGAFKTVVNSIINFAESTINKFIRAINGAIGAINHIPRVNISTVPEMNIPRLARGGVIDNATLAVLGESGREAVVPLENNTGWINEIASKINAVNGGGQPINLTVKIGEDTMIKKVIDGIKDQEYMTNQEVFV